MDSLIRHNHSAGVRQGPNICQEKKGSSAYK